MAIHARTVRSLKGGAILVVLFLAWCLPGGCAGVSGVKTTSFHPDFIGDFETIALMPVQAVAPQEPGQSFARCPLSGAFIRACPIDRDGAEGDLEELFVRELAPAGAFMLIPPARTEGVYRRVRTASFGDPARDVLQTVGTKLEADAVIAGYVYCYRERKGFSYAAEQPASAVFSFHLLRVSDGEIVWSGTFDKTQTSLMSNLLDLPSFVQGGGKWIAVKELAAQGIQELLRTFPVRNGGRLPHSTDMHPAAGRL